MRDKETREDIEDIKEASKSRDFFDILRKRQRRNVMTEAYRETEQAENAFFEERAQKHETENSLDKPILKKSFITGIFLLVLIALIVFAVVFFIQQSAEIEIKFVCALSNEDDNLSSSTTTVMKNDILHCDSTIISKSNLTNVVFCYYYNNLFSSVKELQCNFKQDILTSVRDPNLLCNFKHDILTSVRNSNPFCLRVGNVSANQEYSCSFELTQRANYTTNPNPSNLFEVCYVKDGRKVCIKKNQE